MNRVYLAALIVFVTSFGFLGCTSETKPQGSAGVSPTHHPVGTGPFVFHRWKRDQKLVLKANPKYWGGKPDIETLIMVPIKENTTRQLKLENGEIQILDGISPRSAAELQKQAEIDLIRKSGMNMGYLAFNTKKPPFDNVKIRQAVSLIINKQKIVDLNFQGYGRVADQVVPKTIADFKLDKLGEGALEKAKKLMKESGVKLPIKTELWHMPNPRPYMPEPQKIALLIREELAKIGIEAELIKKKWEFYLRETKDGEHPMCLLGWTADVADPDNFLYVFFSKSNIGTTNISRFDNDKVNKLLIAAQSETDEKKRFEQYQEIENLVRAEAPLIPLVYADQLMATRKSTTGFQLHATGKMDFSKVKSDKKVVVFARGGEASKLDPALVDDGESVVVCRAVYEPLVRYDSDSLELKPCLATSWTKNAAGTEWTFKLRKNVSFHDGTEFDAEAVVFNFERIIDPKNAYFSNKIQNRQLYSCISKVEAVSKHEVKFTLKQVSATFLANLTIYTVHIVSPSAIKSSAAKK